MSIEEVVKYFNSHPYAIIMGKGKLSKALHCTEEQVVTARRIYKGMTKKPHGKVPKVLLFDIETSPSAAFVWGRWNQDIHLEQVISEWFVLCWSAKWLYSDEVMSDRVTGVEAVMESDERIIKSLWKLFDEADIIVAHNGNRFDIPKINSRFVIHGLNPPSSYFKVDTCNVAKYTFGFSSNKLDALAGYFGIPHKLDTNFELWRKCLEGNEEALEYMQEYNKKDVEILEQVYLRLRPYIKGHPNISMLVNEPCCCMCGSSEYEKLEGKYYYTQVSKFQLYRCKECGAIFRGRENLIDKVKCMNVGR